MQRKVRVAALVLLLGSCADAGERHSESAHQAEPVVLTMATDRFPDPVIRLPPDSTRAGALEYQAAVSVLEPPDRVAQLQTRVELTNVSTDSVVTLLDGCTVLVRLYDAGDPSAGPLWSEGSHPGWGCVEGPFLVELAPGESRPFTRAFPVHWLFGKGLEPGRYTVTALFRHAGQALELSAGEANLQPQHAGYRMRVETFLREEDSSLHAIAWIHNDTDRALPLDIPGCALSLYLHRDTRAHGRSSWQWTARTRPARDCATTHLERRTLEPGDSATSQHLWAGVPVARVLGDSLTPGRYHVQAQIRFNYFDTQRIEAGAVELPQNSQPRRRQRL